MLSERYGARVVYFYFANPNPSLASAPAEDAAFAVAVAASIRPNRPGADVVLAEGFMLLYFVVPMILFLRAAQRAASWLACRGRAAAAVRAEYYQQVAAGGSLAVAAGLACTVGLSALNAAVSLTAEHRAAGVSELGVLTRLVFLAYTGGLMVRLVVYAVDVAFLALGRNPHRTLWDDAIALAVVVPVSALVYHNSALSVLTQVAGGLASGLVVKAAVALRVRLAGRVPTDPRRGRRAGGPGDGRAG